MQQISRIKFGDLRVFLFRYIMPGTIVIGYFFTFLIVFDLYGYFIGMITPFSPEIYYVITALLFIGLFSMGLLIRTYPFDHWLGIKGCIQKEYDKINDYICEKLESLNMRVVYDYLYSLKNKEHEEKERAASRAIHQYLEHDKLESKATFFYQAGYIFWFNFLTICLVFYILGILKLACDIIQLKPTVGIMIGLELIDICLLLLLPLLVILPSEFLQEVLIKTKWTLLIGFGAIGGGGVFLFWMIDPTIKLISIALLISYFSISYFLIWRTWIRGKDTLEWYVESSILAIDNFVKNKLNKRLQQDKAFNLFEM